MIKNGWDFMAGYSDNLLYMANEWYSFIRLLNLKPILTFAHDNTILSGNNCRMDKFIGTSYRMIHIVLEQNVLIWRFKILSKISIV